MKRNKKIQDRIKNIPDEIKQHTDKIASDIDLLNDFRLFIYHRYSIGIAKYMIKEYFEIKEIEADADPTSILKNIKTS